MAYIYNLIDTWNNVGTTFTAIKMNVTDTTSSASSMLMDLQVGTVTQFNVRKDGSIYTPNGIVAMGVGGAGPLYISTNSSAIGYNMASGLGVGWTNSATNAVAAPDTILTRRAAANLRLGAADAAAPVAQTLSVQSVIAGTTNAAGANWTFTGSQGTGTGAGGSIIFQVAPAGSTGNTQNALVDAFRIQTGAKLRISAGNVAGNAGTGLYSLDNTAIAFGQDAGSLVWGGITGNGFLAADDKYYGFGSSGMNSPDLFLRRDDANKLALRNGTFAQTFNIYDTYTDVSNYRRTSMYWSGGAFYIDNDLNAGTGITNATMYVKTRGNLHLLPGAGGYDVVTNGNGGGKLYPGGATNTTDLGRSDKKFATGYFGTSVVTSQVTIPLQTLTDGANVAWNCNNGAKAKVTLAGNRTIDAVTNAVEGTSYTLWVIQDATGSRTVTWTTSGAGSFDFGTEGTPVLTTTASAADALGFEAISIGGTLKLRFMGIKRGFA